jgi:Ca2+-binding RTX toxin-like protein
VGGIDLVLSSVTFALAESQVLGGLVSGVENLTLTGSSNINGTGNQLNNIITGNTGNNTLAGNAGNDVLLGNAGDDILQGGIGNDNLQGGAGNDSLDGGTGNDVMNGLGGNDTYVVDSATDQVVESLAGAAGGTDTVLASVSHALDLNVENLTLTGGNNINGTGNSTANTITGNTGNNVLLGGVGLDVLSGGDGNDTLNGGANNDNLTGGLGDDVFVFSTAAGALNNDVVTDFTTGSDKLHFENAIFTAIGVAGAFAATKFFSIAQAGDYTGTSAGMDAADRLVYNTDTGKLYYDANGSVAGGHVLVATLFDGTETPAALSATDIVVI